MTQTATPRALHVKYVPLFVSIIRVYMYMCFTLISPTHIYHTGTTDHIICDPLQVWYGRLNTSDTTMGTTVEVTCADSYTLIGQSKIHCQGDGTWSAIPICKHGQYFDSSSIVLCCCFVIPIVFYAKRTVVSLEFKTHTITSKPYFGLYIFLKKYNKTSASKHTSTSSCYTVYANTRVCIPSFEITIKAFLDISFYV